MRSAIAGPVTPLLGSLGLHGCIALALLLALRHPPKIPQLALERPDAWAGNAVEVDAVATPEAAASPNRAPTAEPSPREPNTAAAPSEAITPPADAPPKLPKRPATEAPSARPASPQARPVKPRTSTATASESTPSDANHGTSANSPATGAFGGEGLPPGVRSLQSAFTRAIPPATAADPLWQSLPVGNLHPFTVAIEVDADGHISSAEILKEKDGSEPELEAKHLRERVVALLGGGLFALQNTVGAGRELFRISITLSDRPTREDDAPAQAVQRGFEPPHGSTPGRAYFTLVSGRHFEAKVQVLTRP